MSGFHILESILYKVGSVLKSPLLLILRLFWGGSFVVTGIGKFVHLGKISAYFDTLGIPLPGLSAFLTASVESVCGACLVLGFASRVVSIPLIFTMVVALSTAHVGAIHGFFADPHQVTHEAPFNFLLTSLFVFIFGPGAISVDRWIRKKEEY